MNKNKLIIIILLILVVGLVWFLIAKTGDDAPVKNILNANGETAFEKLENALKQSGFTYDYMPKVGTNFGASTGAEYALSDGTVIEVYGFVDKSVVYKDILKTGKMYILDTTTSYKVDTVESLNIAVRFLNEGDKIDTVKSILQ